MLALSLWLIVLAAPGIVSLWLLSRVHEACPPLSGRKVCYVILPSGSALAMPSPTHLGPVAAEKVSGQPCEPKGKCSWSLVLFAGRTHRSSSCRETVSGGGDPDSHRPGVFCRLPRQAWQHPAPCGLQRRQHAYCGGPL